MMEIIQILGLGLLVLMLYFFLQEQKSPFAILLVMAFCVIVFLVIIRHISIIMTSIQEISAAAGINRIYLLTILKILGIAYLAEIVAQLCRDGGSSALALKIELAAKISILTLAMPMLLAVVEAILQLLG